MKKEIQTYLPFLFLLFCVSAWSQNSTSTYNDVSYEKAHDLAQKGDYTGAKDILVKMLTISPSNTKARALLASTYSWSGQYAKARSEFNKVTSKEKSDPSIWITAIKNELYAKENNIALGLAQKASSHAPHDDIERLKELAHQRANDKDYPELGWHNTDGDVTNERKAKRQKEKATKKEVAKLEKEDTKKQKPLNTFGVNNSVTVFNERYEPIFFSDISYRRQTPYGTIIPRINYSSRVGKQGVQYDIDLYPKFAKGVYAYMNYGYSNSSIYPKHKAGGDLYVTLPGAIELSAGGRYIVTSTQNISGLTNSIGYYTGNYYFSLRSFITPKSEGLTRVSGNLLIRKYLKHAENFMGLSGGMGISPELRQFFADDRLLAETVFFIESQRLAFEYQFTDKRRINIYRARLGVRRQELSFDSGNFFLGVTAGLTYQVKF